MMMHQHQWKKAARSSAPFLLSVTALITACFAPVMAQQKDKAPHDQYQRDRPVAVSYLA